MKLIITENKRNRLAIKMLEEKYPNFKLYRHPGYSEIFLSDKGMFKMSYSSETKTLYVKDDVWDWLTSWFGFTDGEVRYLLLNWFNDRYRFKPIKCQRVSQI